MPTVSVGIATYERPECLDTVLGALTEQTRPPEEVIVVDDGASDASQTVVVRHEEPFDATGVDLEYVRSDNPNLPAARNELRRLATGDVLAFVDDDTDPPEGWLAALVDGYDAYPDAAAVGGPAISVDGERNPLYELVRSEDNQNRILPDGRIYDRSNVWIPPEVVLVDHLLGANMSFRAAVLDQVGGFDPGYGGTAFREESAVFARLWHRGERVIYNPDARVDHVIRTASETQRPTSKLDAEGKYWRARNSVRLLAREFPETFPRNIVPLLLDPPDRPAPLPKRVAGAVIERPRRTFHFYRGLIDGFRYETVDSSVR